MSDFSLIEQKPLSFEGLDVEEIQNYDRVVISAGLQLFYDALHYEELEQNSPRAKLIDEVLIPHDTNRSVNYKGTLSFFFKCYLEKEFDIYLDQVIEIDTKDGFLICYHCKNPLHIINDIYEDASERIYFLGREMSGEDFRKLKEAAMSLFNF